MKTTAFKTWLLQQGYTENTANSYAYYVEKISEHFSEKQNKPVDVFEIKDLDAIKQLVENYSTSGIYADFGYKGHGTARNAIKSYYHFRSDLKPDSTEVFAQNVVNRFYEELTDLMFLYIENDRELIHQYLRLVSESNLDTVNRALGKKIKEKFGMENLDVNRNPKSKLIQSFTKHI
jgi:hypothetical protein